MTQIWLKGIAVRGHGRGKRLQFPTANLKLLPGVPRPAEGIWACWVKLPPLEKVLMGALHVGPVPTFEQEEATVELHILHFPYRELYDQHILFSCVKRLRDIQKFDTIQSLQAAIARDVDAVESLLKEGPPQPL